MSRTVQQLEEAVGARLLERLRGAL
ncbi:hypothetical protein [Amycolatopsis sp. NPDC052450]